MELSKRKLQILRAVIEEYAETGTPVGSRSLSKRADLALSAATIRNEMADLEELGFLEKMHTSSGRRPSVQAYRLYVDKMLRVDALTPAEMERARSFFNRRLAEMSAMLDAAAEALSDLTTHIGLVLEPEDGAVCLKRVQLVKVSDSRGLVVLVTDSGIVKDSVIEIPPLYPSAELEHLSNVLSASLLNVPLNEASQAVRKLAQNAVSEQKRVMGSVLEAINKNTGTQAMHLGGRQNIWKFPEYRDLGKAERLLKLLETEDTLAALLDQGKDLEFSIRIGSELPDHGLNDLSVVTATYRAGSHQLGSFGIIGPIRMDYGRVLSVLRFVGMSLSDALSDFMEAGRE